MPIDHYDNRITKLESDISTIYNGFISLKDTMEKVKVGLLGSLDGSDVGLLNKVRENDIKIMTILKVVEDLQRAKEAQILHNQKIDQMVTQVEALKIDSLDTNKKKWLFGLVVSGIAACPALVIKLFQFLLK